MFIINRDIKIGINLDLSIVDEFNSLITENNLIYKNYAIKNKGSNEIYQWGKLTAIIYHLRETGTYLNSDRMIFNLEDEYIRYKFIEFLNFSTQIHEMILMLYDIFEINKTSIKKEQKYFNLDDFRKYIGENNLTDEGFLNYIRSLVVAHPLDTSYHVKHGFQLGMEFSPYIDPITTIHRIMKFPQVFNTGKKFSSDSQLSIKVTHGSFKKEPIYDTDAKYIETINKHLEALVLEEIITQEEVEISKKQMETNLEEMLILGTIDEDEYEIMMDDIKYGKDLYILVDIKDFISFTESRYQLLNNVICKLKDILELDTKKSS